jgi:hypothetical protein
MLFILKALCIFIQRAFYIVKMKRIFFIFYFLFFIFYCQSQNLVPNYSFEFHTSCPNAGGQINFSPPWYSPTAATPDYFNVCGISGLGIPLNIWGYQYPETGYGYGEVAVYGGSTSASFREYIQVQLIDSLIVDHEYCVNFFVSSCGINGYSNSYTPITITEIGLLFSNNAIITNNTLPLPYTPQISSPAGVFLSDTAQWMEISGTYTALGGERFITIGNFKNDASTDTMQLLNNGLDPQGYYYVDDVSIILCDTANSINEYKRDFGVKLYPNPNNGEMTLEYSLNESETGILNLYDVTGKSLEQISLNSKFHKLILNETSLQAGVYYYSILVNNKPVQTEKLIIIK